MPSASSKSSQVGQQNIPADLLQEPMKNAVSVLEKKLRNLEKRKIKLLETKKKAEDGCALNDDQKRALESLVVLDYNLDCVKEMHKNLITLETEYSKLCKKEQKRTKLEQKDQVESRSQQIVHKVVEIQAILGELTEEVRPDFIAGTNGACLLTADDLENLDNIYELINPTTGEEKDEKLSERVQVSKQHLINLVEAKNKSIEMKNKTIAESVTYKGLYDIIEKIKASGYFDKDISNGQTDTDPVEEIKEEEKPVITPSVVVPQEESPEDKLQEAPDTLDAPVIPVNGVDLPPEVTETPENEAIDFMGESEISAGLSDSPPTLNPVSPEFVPRNKMSIPPEDGSGWDPVANQEKSGWGDNQSTESGWKSVEGGNQQGGNYKGRGGGRGGRGGNFRGRGRGGGGNYRGGNRDGNYRGDYRGGNRGGRGGSRGNFRGGPRGGRAGERGSGPRGGGSERSGGFGRPQQQS